MAKRLDLSAEILNTPVVPPQAARAARTAFVEEPPVAPVPVPAPPKVKHIPLQLRIPRTEAKKIKMAAVDAEKTISDFMLECFHACMQPNKQS